MDHNNEAKGSCPPRVTYMKREQRECRPSASITGSEYAIAKGLTGNT